MFFVIQRGSQGGGLLAAQLKRELAAIRDIRLAAYFDPTRARLRVDTVVVSLEAGEGSYLASSERLLRAAAARERRYWPNFALGRTLYFQQEHAAAELAFSHCASLRPDYARGYEQRALMVAHQSASATSPYLKSELRRRAEEDSDRALNLALGDRDPSTYWPRGDALALLEQPQEALEAYARALLWEEDIRQKVNRRNNVHVAAQYASAILLQDSATAELKSDAHAVLALCHLATGETAGAAREAEAALAGTPTHPTALTVRGMLQLDEAARQPSETASTAEVYRRAADAFEQALHSDPLNYRAAAARAEALDHYASPAARLKAWSVLLERPESGGQLPSLALTDAQQAAAHLGRARALSDLGRTEESEKAERAAKAIE